MRGLPWFVQATSGFTLLLGADYGSCELILKADAAVINIGADLLATTQGVPIRITAKVVQATTGIEKSHREDSIRIKSLYPGRVTIYAILLWCFGKQG